METLSKEIKLKVLKIVLDKIKSDPLYDMCETIRLTVESELGLKIDGFGIRRIFKLKQFKPLDESGAGHWWPLDEKGQLIRQVIVESLIEDLEKE